MPVPVLSVSDGSRTTVNDLVGMPMAIPARILQLAANAFISETLLRDAGSNTNGLVSYRESTPLYLSRDVEQIAEFAEIPVAAGQMGLPRLAYALKKGLGVRVSKEMRDENNIDAVNLQITQLVNTMVRAEERALRALFSNPTIPTIAATAAWGTSTSLVRHDIARAVETIGAAAPSGTLTSDDNFGFMADTMAMHSNLGVKFVDDDKFNSVFQYAGPVSGNISYTGVLPGQIMGLDTLQSRSWDPTRVLICERKTVGFYSDTRRLNVTPLYGEGGGPNGGPTETWRSDATRKRALGVDQPFAACWITGVQ